MSKRKAPAKKQVTLSQSAGRYFTRLLNIWATIYFGIAVVGLPLFMDREKYHAITAAKAGYFNVLSAIALIGVIGLVTAMYLYTIDDKKEDAPRPALGQMLRQQPLLMADLAIITYWLLMLVSCLLSEDKTTSFYGLDPRNNGFFYQTLYVAAYFIISRAMKPAEWKGLLFVWGGAILAVLCILHYYGVDVYDVVHFHMPNAAGEIVEGRLKESFAGPFWNSTTYRFMGPVGNVNLGSYILSVALVLAAGFYITGVQPRFPGVQSRLGEPDEEGVREVRSLFRLVTDKFGISLVVCFVIILFAELNINTDAGLVAMAAAVLAVPVALCGSFERLSRALTVFAAAAGTVLLDNLIDSALRKDGFGTTAKVLVMLTLVLVFMAVAAGMIKNKPRFRDIPTRRLRTVMSCLVVLAIVGGITLSLVITQPDDPAAGALSGTSAVLEQEDVKEKSDTIIHELGQMLRGNFDDSFGHNRLFTWKRTLTLVKYHPVFGIGPDNFARFFARYYRQEAVEMFPSSNGNLDKAHNEFLDVLLCNGIAGLTAYLAFFGVLLWCCFRNADSRRFAPVFGVAVLSYMAHAFFGYQLPIQSPVMWMMIGAAAAYAKGETAESLSASGTEKHAVTK